MRDFNFFEPYITVSSKPDRSKLLFALLLFVLVVALASYQVTIIIATNKIKQDIATIDAFLMAPETLQKVSDVDTKQAHEVMLTQTHQDLLAIKAQLEVANTIDTMLIESVNAQMPAEVFLTQMNMQSGVVSLTGYAKEVDTIAQFGFNLRNISQFSNILIPTITEMDGQYQFAITAEWLEGGQE